MIIPLLIGLILLAVLIAAGFAVGSKRRGLAAASNLFLPSPQKRGNVVPIENRRPDRATVLLTRHSGSKNSVRPALASEILPKQVVVRPTIPRPRKNGSIQITPSPITKVNPPPVMA